MNLAKNNSPASCILQSTKITGNSNSHSTNTGGYHPATRCPNTNNSPGDSNSLGNVQKFTLSGISEIKRIHPASRIPKVQISHTANLIPKAQTSNSANGIPKVQIIHPATGFPQVQIIYRESGISKYKNLPGEWIKYKNLPSEWNS